MPRSSTSPDFVRRCRACYIQRELCLCSEVVKVETKVRILILRHALESWRTTNTARIAMLALPNGELHEHGGPSGPFDLDLLRQPGTCLLFPGGATDSLPPEPIRHLLVLDGSWPQARRMLQRIDGLWGLPRLSLPQPPSPPRRLRTVPTPEGRSTLEAIADALTLLEGPDAGRKLHALHELMVERVLETRRRGGKIVLPREASC